MDYIKGTIMKIKLQGHYEGFNSGGNFRDLAGDFEADSKEIATEVGRQIAQGFEDNAQVECAMSDFIIQLLEASQMNETSVSWVKWQVNQRTKVKK